MKYLLPLLFLPFLIFFSCRNAENNSSDTHENNGNTVLNNQELTDIEDIEKDNTPEKKSAVRNAVIPYKIEGYVKNGANIEVTLDKLGIGNLFPIEATSANEQGYFTFEGHIEEPGLYQLRFAHGAIHLILTGGTVKIEAEVDHISRTYEITGSDDSKYLKELYLLINSFNDRKEKLQARLDNASNNRRMEEILDSLPFLQKQIEKDKSEALQNFINRIDTSLVVLLAANYMDPLQNTAFLQEVVDKTRPYYSNQVFFTSLENKVKHYAPFARGKVAPDIVLTDTEGNERKLSDLRGKYVLLDFWASWCKPCRGEHPDLKKIYNRYKSRGFEIFSVSLDENRSDWMNAIQKDGITWIQTSDLLGWESAPVQLYNINAIPATFLLDPQGRIMAKDIRAMELQKKLSEIMM